jgi:hypothetical protein
MDESNNRSAATPGRLPWKPPALKLVGEIGEVLKSGVSKVTPNVADPGEGAGKPPGK